MKLAEVMITENTSKIEHVAKAKINDLKVTIHSFLELGTYTQRPNRLQSYRKCREVPTFHNSDTEVETKTLCRL